MSIVLIIAIPVLLVLAAVMIFATGRRRASTGPSGSRSRGTLERRDEAARLERAGRPTASRRRPRTRASAPTRPARRSARAARPRDPRQRRGRRAGAGRRGRARHQPPAVLQPGHPRHDGAEPRRVRRRGDRFLWPVAPAASAARSTPASASTDVHRLHRGRTRQPYYVPEARTYLAAVPEGRRPEGQEGPAVPAGARRAWKQGIVALYQKCVHLGCRVPWCQTSQWFECPCHGSKYNRVGEKQRRPGPARARPLRRHRSPAASMTHRHRARRPSARRSAPTPPARAPKARLASDDQRLHRRWTVAREANVILALTFRTILVDHRSRSR